MARRVLSFLVAFTTVAAAAQRLDVTPAEVFVPTGLASQNTQTAVTLPDGRVLIVCDGTNGTAVANLYDPMMHTLAATGSMNYGRGLCAAALLQDGTVLITGGNDNATAELYTPSTGQFTLTNGLMAERRHGHRATLLSDGRVLITGGQHRETQFMEIVPLRTAEIYDPLTKTFAATNSMGSRRSFHTSTLLTDGRVFVSGGFTSGNFEFPTAATEIYDPSTSTFAAGPMMAAPRATHTATRLPDSSVLVVGVSTLSTYRVDPEIYRPATNSFVPASATEAPDSRRGDHFAVSLTDGRVLIAGGSGNYLQELIYDPTTAQFTAVGRLRTAEIRRFQYITGSLLPRGDVLIAGGPIEIFDVEVSATVKTEFDSRSSSDVFWRNNATGENHLWLMSGTAITDAITAPALDPSWNLAAIADFDGDRMADIFWRHDTGLNAVWLMNGAVMREGAILAAVDLSWTVVGVADFNGDEKADIFWRDTGGANGIWFFNGTSIVGEFVQSLDSSWKAAGIGDFDTDGKGDVLWRHESSGANAIWFMDGSTLRSGVYIPSVEPGWEVSGLGDFNADVTTDILWRHGPSGLNALWFMSGATRMSGMFIPGVDLPWTVAATADFDFDRQTDLLWRNPSTGQNVIWMLKRGSVTSSVAEPTLTGDWTPNALPTSIAP